jgi:hypothetical protein
MGNGKKLITTGNTKKNAGLLIEARHFYANILYNWAPPVK